MRGLNGPVFLAFCLAASMLAGCGARDLSKPPKMHYGRDVCAQCRMIIGDERFAAAVVTGQGEVFKFDDIGCMQSYSNNNATPGSRAWVHDFESVLWIEAQSAEFLKFPDLVTPMGSGIAAYQRRKST